MKLTSRVLRKPVTAAKASTKVVRTMTKRGGDVDVVQSEVAEANTPRERLHVAYKDYAAKNEAAKVAGSAAGKAQTVLKNTFKDFLDTEKLHRDTKVAIGGIEFSYGQNETSEYPVEIIYRKFKEKKITEAQFLECISASTSDIKRVLGNDEFERGLIKGLTKRAAVRMNDAAPEFKKGFHIIRVAPKPIVTRPAGGQTKSPSKSGRQLFLGRRK